MRLRNVKNKKEIINNCPIVVFEPEKNKGTWKKVFGNDNPIYIEIGMGKGNFIIENAKRYPDINFIGIEKFDSVLSKAIKKIDEEITNLRFIRMDAKEIENVFDKEVSRIYLNFSDPWPKNRHHERRLTSNTFLKRYDSIFKVVKEIHQKTDNRDLFEYSIVSFSNYNYMVDKISLDLHNSDIEDNIMTEYETKFAKQDKVIYYIVVKK